MAGMSLQRRADARRKRYLQQKLAVENSKRAMELAAAEKRAFDSGAAFGRGIALSQVLFASGRLYERGKDTDAAAVREVYRALSANPSAKTAKSDEEKKA